MVQCGTCIVHLQLVAALPHHLHASLVCIYQLIYIYMQEEPQGLSSNSLREYSDPSLRYSRQPAHSAATTPADPLHPTPTITHQPAGGHRAVDQASSEQAHSRQQDSNRPTRFQQEAPAGESPFCISQANSLLGGGWGGGVECAPCFSHLATP